jgi:hypothetical protein
MRITDKAKEFLSPCNDTRIKLMGIVERKHTELVSHNCHKDKHVEYFITIKDVRADINGRIGFIKKYIILSYNPKTSDFKYVSEGKTIEFYVRIFINDDNLFIERPTKISTIVEIN